MIAGLLNAIGLPGQIISAVAVLFGLYHIRGIIQVLSRVTTVVWIAVVGVGVFAAIAMAAPGVDLVVHLETLVSWFVSMAGGVVQGGGDILKQLIGVVA